MKLEVGMYVRFDWRKQQTPILIGKITEEHYDELCDYCYSTDLHLVITEDNVIKASHNIMVLIKVGDYVNGHRVIFVNDTFTYASVEVETSGEATCEIIPKDNIKSILTKEQMEQMSYRIGDEE